MIETTVIGSYPIQPDREGIMKNYFNQKESNWKKCIEEAVNDLLKAGIDIISDGQTRDPFIQLFARKLEGCRIRARAEIIDEIKFNDPITLEDQKYVKSIIPANKKLKGIITGPYTLTKSCVNLHYDDEERASFDFAHALKEEALHLQKYVDMVDIDEPFFSISYPEYGKELIQIIVKKLSIPVALHVCGDVSGIIPELVEMPVDILCHEFKAHPKLFDAFGDHSFPQYLCIGSVRSDSDQIESVNEIVSHIKKAIDLFGDKVIQISPDCGQRSLPRKIAYKKLENLVKAMEVVNG